jgi:predicted amidohydrolase YtcJ
MGDMKILILSTLFVVVLAASTVLGQDADTVFSNGNIYTVNETQPRAEAIAVRGSRIVFVGSNAGSNKYVGRSTKIIDLKGATVVPG